MLSVLAFTAITIGILLKSWILPAGHGFHPMRLLYIGRWRIVFGVLLEGYAVGKHRSMKSYPGEICEKKYNGVMYECQCDATEAPCGG